MLVLKAERDGNNFNLNLFLCENVISIDETYYVVSLRTR